MRKLAGSLINENGSIMILAVLILILLALTGIYGAYRSSTETRIASNNNKSVQVLYVAEAGVEESKARLNAIFQAGTPDSTWRAFIGNPQAATELFPDDPYEPDNSNHHQYNSQQSGLEYVTRIRHKTESDCGQDLDGDGNISNTAIVFWGDIDADHVLEQNINTGEPIEIITSTGVLGSATTTISVEVFRDLAKLEYAVFGNKYVETKNGGKIWKGNANPPYEADIGANGHIEIKSGALIYGSVDIGEDPPGTPGTCTNLGGTIYGGGPNYRRCNRPRSAWSI